ncbi:hypothetical protein [Virgisporangium aurantiacum]|uniref:Uncharacterized protein n=1 Tax=Virgisporangium aurantiacum TaxID=175570 RepID=A0A8J3ZJD2_9ACTN|nr:hypothetical protein [Virgisporangium aurantiacum]GIJ62601.1 hypothetical protein Vau01_101170 [Virgisporangium aurantiacum]
MHVYGWRVTGVAFALLLVTVPWDRGTDVVGLIAVVPVVVWYCAVARGPGWGLFFGGVLTAFMAWMVVPDALGWTGRWLVPSRGDMLTWYPWVSAGVCFLGSWVESRSGTRAHRAWVRITAMVLAGLSPGWLCLTCPGWWLTDFDKPPDDEGVFPMPAGLIVSEDYGCVEGSCFRTATVTGDRADARVRAHLAGRGYHLRPDNRTADEYRANKDHADDVWAVARRRTGILIPHHVWLHYRATPDGTVHLTWTAEYPIDLPD